MWESPLDELPDQSALKPGVSFIRSTFQGASEADSSAGIFPEEYLEVFSEFSLLKAFSRLWIT